MLTQNFERPQAKSNGWSDGIYLEDDNIVHRLGNLLLLPENENGQLLKNRSWRIKRDIFKLLATENVSDFETLKERISRDHGLNFGNRVTQILNESNYLQMCKSIGAMPAGSEWTTELIDRRSENIAKLAWDKLNSWIKPLG